MLDDANFISRAADGSSHFALEARKTVDQRWDAAEQAKGIAHHARRLPAAGGWQRDNRHVAHEPRWQLKGGIGSSGLAEENEVHGARPGKILDERSGP